MAHEVRYLKTYDTLGWDTDRTDPLAVRRSLLAWPVSAVRLTAGGSTEVQRVKAA